MGVWVFKCYVYVYFRTVVTASGIVSRAMVKAGYSSVRAKARYILGLWLGPAVWVFQCQS